MSIITSQSIRDELKQVRDPLLGRDIVSTGQLTRAEVSPERIALSVNLPSPGYPHRGELDDAIREALRSHGLAIEIDWGLDVPRKVPKADQDRMPTVRNVIAVAAGKGGVGKSTVSVNLALALQRLGARVGMLDADIYGPSVPKMLGDADRAAEKSADGSRIQPAMYRGMPVMSVEFFVETGRAVIWRGPMIHKLLQQFLEDVEWGELDYLIIDLPPGTGDAQLSLGQLIPITGGLLVTTPQEIALLDVRKAVDMFNKLSVPLLGVIENMSHYECPNCGHKDDVFSSGGGRRLAEEFDLELLGQLPLDRRVSHGGESGQPVIIGAPEGAHARAIESTAIAAAARCAKLSATGPKRSTKLRTI